MRLAPAFRSCFRFTVRPWISSSPALACRPLSSSSQGLPSETLTADVIEENAIFDEPDSTGEEGGETPRSYRTFMNTIGYQYRFARPQNWLGQNVVKCLVIIILFSRGFIPICSALPHESLLQTPTSNI
jgi:hypothetical protein